MAGTLGLELPWDVDGRMPHTGEVPGRDRRRARAGEKELIDWPGNRLAASIDDEALLVVDAAEGLQRVLEADPVAGSGPLALWQASLYGGQVGNPADDLDEANNDARQVEVTIDGADRFDDIDLDDPLPLELTGTVDGCFGHGSSGLAIAVNGTVAGITTIPEGVGSRTWRVLLWPAALVDGENQIDVYCLSGGPENPMSSQVPWDSR